MKIRPMGAEELFHAGGRTDMTKLIIAFRNFANAPKNQNTRFIFKNFFSPKVVPCRQRVIIYYVAENMQEYGHKLRICHTSLLFHGSSDYAKAPQCCVFK